MGEAEAFLDQAGADAEAPGGRFDQQEAEPGGAVVVPDAEGDPGPILLLELALVRPRL